VRDNGTPQKRGLRPEPFRGYRNRSEGGRGLIPPKEGTDDPSPSGGTAAPTRGVKSGHKKTPSEEGVRG